MSLATRLNWLILNFSLDSACLSEGITTGFPISPGPVGNRCIIPASKNRQFLTKLSFLNLSISIPALPVWCSLSIIHVIASNNWQIFPYCHCLISTITKLALLVCCGIILICDMVSTKSIYTLPPKTMIIPL